MREVHLIFIRLFRREEEIKVDQMTGKIRKIYKFGDMPKIVVDNKHT